nr:hypothetical protein [Tanacetum cinerariifolium]
MLKKENYVPWSSRLLRYAKSRPNGKLIHNSILNGPYVRRMIPEPGDANRDTILLGLPEDIYAAVDSCETAQEIWLRVQQMMKGFDIGIQEKKARQYARQNAGNPAVYNDVIRNQVIQNAVRNPRVQNVGNQNGLIGVQGNRNQNQIRNDNLVVARTEGNAAGQNGNQIRCYNCKGVGHYARNCTIRQGRKDAAYLQIQLLIAQKEEAGIQLQTEEYDLMAAVADMDEIKEVNANCILMANLQQAVEDLKKIKEVNANYILMANLQQASTSGTQIDSAPVYDLDGSAENDNNVISAISSAKQSRGTVKQHPATAEETCALYDSLYDNLSTKVETVNLVNQADKSLAKNKALEFKIERLLRAVVSQDIMSIVQSNYVVDTSNLQTELDRTKEKLESCIIKKEKEYDILWNNWYIKCKECKYDKISYDKTYKDMQQKIKRLQAHLRDLKGKREDTPCESDTLDPLSQKLENENVELEFQDFSYAKENTHLKTTYMNLFDSIYIPPKVVEMNDLSNTITSNLVPTITESKDVINDTMIPPVMFRINSFKTSREDKFVPINKVRASVRTNLITVSQPHVITKKHVNSDSNALFSTEVDNTA